MVSHKSSRTSVRLAPQAIISNVRLSAAKSDSTCLWSMTCIATSPVVICLMASGPRDNSVVLMMASPPRIDTQDTTCAPKVPGSAQTATQSVTASSGKLLYLSIMREIDSLLVAPTTRSTSFPPLNRIKVGMPLIPYVAAVDGLSSTFSLTTARLPEYCSAIASTFGDNIRQGAHQAAQKSTSTGLSDFRTSCSKELSVTSLTLSFIFVVPSYLARNARKFLRLTPLLLFTSPRRQALLAQFFSRLQKLLAKSRAGHCLGQRERAVHQGEQADCLFVACASSINHLSE